ncbi:hypothetical protein CCB80_14400 [Armatimonadetes bacterium Uphvl-Ar1]|nr:hypothetical protein CCB80_14400 [Armatimonadetes bacterium Uphvl-Ar1]
MSALPDPRSIQDSQLSLPINLDLNQVVLNPIAELPSNLAALALGLDFACGQQNFIGVGGPSGWGKSELLHRVREILKHSQGIITEVQSADQWAISNSPACRNSVLLLDDLQDALRSPRLRHLLRLRLEHRLRRNLPTMICTAENFDKAIRNRIISPLSGWHLAEINAPSLIERQRITHQIAKVERINLHPSIESLIALHLNGNGRSIRGALLRMKLVKSNWATLDDFAEACGVLMPFLIGEDGWDPRDVVTEALNHVYLAWPSSAPLGKRAALAYLLNQVIRLAEEDVACFLRVRPGQVYRHCKSVQDRLDNPEVRQFIDVLRTHTFAALAHSADWTDSA